MGFSRSIQVESINYSQEIGLHGDSCSDALSGDDLTIGEVRFFCVLFAYCQYNAENRRVEHLYI